MTPYVFTVAVFPGSPRAARRERALAILAHRRRLRRRRVVQTLRAAIFGPPRGRLAPRPVCRV